ARAGARHRRRRAPRLAPREPPLPKPRALAARAARLAVSVGGAGEARAAADVFETNPLGPCFIGGKSFELSASSRVLPEAPTMKIPTRLRSQFLLALAVAFAATLVPDASARRERLRLTTL